MTKSRMKFGALLAAVGWWTWRLCKIAHDHISTHLYI